MKINLIVGIIGSKEIIVKSLDTAARYGFGLIEVFATPAMIGLMESTAQQSVQSFLPEGFITLGTEVNIKHLKATLPGMKVKCETKLISVEGKKLIFEVNVWDEIGHIGSGLHTRFIVDVHKFMEKLKKAN
ncbi:MAG: thioesterase family protein [Bacteroidetes bacterium]|nr:thioesterase family protein [Bacteroidota bacterium]